MSQSVAPLARLDAIGKRYAGEMWALRDIDWEVPPGAVIGLVGANGSGKSTLLRILAGRTRATTGNLALFGRSVNEIRSASLRRCISLVGQDPAVDPDQTARELLVFFGRLFGETRLQSGRRAAELISAFGLRSVADQRLARVSGGQRQRLHIALGLVHKPQLLMLDEPTNALDMHARTRLWETLRDHKNDDRTVVISSHRLDEIGKFCDQVLVLADGRAKASDTIQSVVVSAGATDLDDAFTKLTGQPPPTPRPAGGGRKFGSRQ